MVKKIIEGIEVAIYFRKVKNLRIKVNRDGGVSLIIPTRISEQVGISFLKSKMSWVKKCLSKSQGQSPRFTFSSGDKFYLQGKEIALFVVDSDKNDYLLEDDRLTLFVKNNEKVKEYFYTVLKQLLISYSKPYFEKWEGITGLKSSKLSIHKTVSRWGSCNTQTRAVNLSLYLINLPEYCLDYVILHELCHIKYADHGVRFKRLLSMYMPTWQEVRAYMRENGNKLRIKE